MAQGKQAPVHDANAPIYSYAIGDEGKNQANRAAAKRPNHRAEVGGTSLRRLFTLREIFEKPVAFREDHL